MIIANVRVNLSSAETLSCASIPKNAVGLKVCFQYDNPLWNKLSKTAVFRNSTRTINSILTDDCAVIPHELLNKATDIIYVGLYGTDSNRALAIPTVWAKLGEVSSAANPSSSVTAEATLPYWAQIKEKVDFLKEEMMIQEDLDRALLQAKESGAFDGPQGPKGEQGEQGETGPAGYTPVAGVDFWTTDDKQSITTEAAIIAANAIQYSSDIICSSNGTHMELSDSSNRELHGLKLYGKTIQNGTPTPDAPVPLETIGDDGAIVVKVGISEANENQQILTIKTLNGLPGIPVSSGGNYTDENGQRWICDEIDFARGKYVQRVYHHTFDGTEDNVSWVTNANWHINSPLARADMGRNPLMCSHYPSSATSSVENTGYINSGGLVVFNDKRFSSMEQLTSYLAENKPTICYPLATPIETDLTVEEIAQYSALHANYPNTTINNDAGADMEVAYVADTKLYIDRRISELTTAL